jgi:hypothetical protein
LSELLAQAARPAEPVDGPVSGGDRDTGAGVVGRAVDLTSLEGDGKGLLDRLLREVQVAQRPSERGDRSPRLQAKQAVDELLGRVYVYISTIGLTSTTPPYFTDGIAAAASSASSRVAASIR